MATLDFVLVTARACSKVPAKSSSFLVVKVVVTALIDWHLLHRCLVRHLPEDFVLQISRVSFPRQLPSCSTASFLFSHYAKCLVRHWNPYCPYISAYLQTQLLMFKLLHPHHCWCWLELKWSRSACSTHWRLKANTMYFNCATTRWCEILTW